MSAGAVVETRPTNWQQGVELFRAGDGLNIGGASGELDYDPVTEETSGLIETWRIEGGSIVGIEVWNPSTLCQELAYM